MIIFIFCYRILPPPEGCSLSLRAFWLLFCPGLAVVAGLVIFGIAGLIARSVTVFAGGLSSFIFFSAIIYASCCLALPDEIKAVYTRIYIREEKAGRIEKRDKEIEKAIEKNIEKQKTIPKALLEKQPLKLVIKETSGTTPSKKETQEQVKNQVENQVKSAKETGIAVKSSDKKNDDGSGSPFDYGADELGGYIPVKGQKVLPDVSIKGILTLQNGESVAALCLKDKKRSFYVRKGNVIRLQDKKSDNNISEIYLQVREIKDNEVEIIQQQRPDKVIIIR